MKADIDRTALTLAASPDLETLRAELDRVLSAMEDGKISAACLGPELVKLGVAVSLPLSGPVETLQALTSVTLQLAGTFPAEWQTAKARMSCRGQA